MKMKLCNICCEVKDSDKFYKNGDRLRGDCKVCNDKRKVKWQRDNKVRFNSIQKKHRDKKFVVTVERNRKSSRECYRKLRHELLLKVSEGEIKCKVCGFDDIRALQIDHIEGGGRRLLGNKPMNHYRALLLDIELQNKCQILCANCNSIKRYEKEENGKAKRNIWEG